MIDLSNGVVREKQGRRCLKPIPSLAIFILVPLFLVGLSVSIFFLRLVRVALFPPRLFHSLEHSQLRHQSLSETDLSQAKHGQLVKITGSASCGTISLESSYERANRCLYASTLLCEHGALDIKPLRANRSHAFNGAWHIVRFSTDFYITDKKSGLRAIVKAGSGCRVIPLIAENELVNTARQCSALSPPLRKRLRERNLSDEARVLRLEEGYVQEGSTVSVVGVVSRNNGTIAIVQPPEVVSTGCLWKKLLLPVDIDGLMLGVSLTTDLSINTNSGQNLDSSRTV